jgi:hypothetical protein
VLEWFRLGQPEIAQAIHDSQESPISLSGLIGKQPGRTVQEGDAFYIRLGLLHGSLLVPLLRGLEQQGQSAFCLAQFPFVIKGIDLLPGTNSWSRSSDYALLVQTLQYSSLSRSSSYRQPALNSTVDITFSRCHCLKPFLEIYSAAGMPLLQQHYTFLKGNGRD